MTIRNSSWWRSYTREARTTMTATTTKCRRGSDNTRRTVDTARMASSYRECASEREANLQLNRTWALIRRRHAEPPAARHGACGDDIPVRVERKIGYRRRI